MEIVIGGLKLSSEFLGSDDKDCQIKIQVKDNPNTLEVKASELLVAIEALNRTCWRP